MWGQVQATPSRQALVMPDTQGPWSKSRVGLCRCFSKG